mmetsp:Transcript_57912/g.161625  ORF Transcript_57912/g.161625 Transcript_57912/m.161625 type:complete len:228 (+) Transcript_57912:32-715(+)
MAVRRRCLAAGLAIVAGAIAFSSSPSPRHGVPADRAIALPCEDVRRRRWILGHAGFLCVDGVAAAARAGEGAERVRKTDDEWRKALSPLEFSVLRLRNTEDPWSSPLSEEKRRGVYKCAGCGAKLFSSADKFDSGTGWPSFAAQLDGVSRGGNLFGVATELRCARCEGHLGDLFSDGRTYKGTKAEVTGLRYCVDGAALVFYPDDGGAAVRGDIGSNMDKLMGRLRY